MKRLVSFLFGIAAGIGLAMLIGWNLFPMACQEVTPASMRDDYQAEYVRLVALTYRAEGDLELAAQRLRTLQTDPYTEPLVVLTETWIAERRNPELIAPLVELARAFEVDTPAMVAYLGAEG